jgi:hypothetical protein
MELTNFFSMTKQKPIKTYLVKNSKIKIINLIDTPYQTHQTPTAPPEPTPQPPLPQPQLSQAHKSAPPISTPSN